MDYAAAKQEALLRAARMQVGDVENSGVCPACGGGRNGDKSFRLAVYEDGVQFKCYRIKCGFGGSSRKYSPAGVVAKRPAKKFTGTSRLMSEDERASILALYPSLAREYVNVWTYSESHDRVMIPCCDPRGYRWGEEGKKLRVDWIKPDNRKSILYFDEYPHPGVSYAPLQVVHLPLVLVEDNISALCLASQGYNAAAVLGTSLTASRIFDIAKRFSHVVVALDPDANTKAVRLAAAMSPYITSSVVFLEKDLKDSTPDEINNVLGELCGEEST